MDESWRRYLVNVLSEPVGVNLRNRIAHGLVTRVARNEAALLIHVASHLALMGVADGETPNGS
jgi:hypothetical protein